MHKPLFSIITVVFNGKDLLKITANSVLQQTSTNYEYLIIDGNSNDGTLDLVKQLAAQHPQVRYLSERDRGLYDAMNKGLQMATGQYVWFMNAGDEIASPDILATLERIAETANPDVFYSDTILVNDARQPLGLMSQLSTRSLPESLQVRDYLYGMRVVHQSFVPRRSLCPPYQMGNLCADYAWCIQILRKSKKTHHVPVESLSRYLTGGMSKRRHRQSLKDRFAVMRTEFGLLPAVWAHGIIVLRALVHRLKRIGKERY